MAYRRGGLPTLYNGYLEPIVIFPIDGYVVHGDLLNNGTECVVIYEDGKASIFADKFMDINVYKRETIKQSKRLSHSTLYQGQDFDNVAHKNAKTLSFTKGDFHEFKYKTPLTNGRYDITMIFGGQSSSCNINSLKSGDRKLIFKSISTEKGEFTKKIFSLNIVDEELTILIEGEKILVDAIEIKKFDAKTIFLAGDSSEFGALKMAEIIVNGIKSNNLGLDKYIKKHL